MNVSNSYSLLIRIIIADCGRAKKKLRLNSMRICASGGYKEKVQQKEQKTNCFGYVNHLRGFFLLLYFFTFFFVRCAAVDLMWPPYNTFFSSLPKLIFSPI